MDRGDWFLPRRIQSNTNPSDSVLLDVEEVPDSVEEVPDSVEEVLDINAVVHCPRCSTFHAGGVFGEACKQARRNARRCSRCGLLHEDYDFFAQVLDDMEKFDCEFYIPDVKKLQMSGNTIILPEEVIEKLEEREKKKQAKNNTKN
jgi:recombinational DNA repair protein RecR